jgi:hypothetical protein
VGEGEQDEQMQQSMEELSEAMGEQRALRDETQAQRDGGGGSGGNQQGGQGGDQLAERQAEIRDSLGEAQQMADEAGAAPSEDLNAAGEAMRRAEDALQRGDFEGAEAAQSAALDSLREGAEALAAEMILLRDTNAGEIDTTLLIHPHVLGDFEEYNAFLDVADAALESLDLDGVLQVASFHPDYRFAGTADDDATNCTNRSPYPILHLLREESVSRAVETFPDPDAIIERND